ncbi:MULTISPECIES: hypothetical protein [Clostridium]|uniref:Uncharacterized protein n=1 Tax=Clostridium cibarium TaxID=2762247 RepID=A0ABR8PV41_9CLOT|nr:MULTISPECIES: hypothetical protein [Clostridium]MBD7912036.1 hypothetical protein [Clostridium cibarium]
MLNIISLMCLFLLAMVFVILYIKDKKAYQFLGIIDAIIAIFFKTPFSIGISKTLENTLVGIMLILMIIIFYLLMSDNREKYE